MKKPAILFLFLFICLPLLASSKMVNMDLSEAIKSKMVTMTAINEKGMYCGKTTKLIVKNISSNELQLKVNLGIVLMPDSMNTQPMVLSGEEMLVVQPSKEGEVLVSTFCGNAPLQCPDKDFRYSFGYVGNDTLVKLLRFIKTNSYYGYLAQYAVWAITNGNSIGTVYDEADVARSTKFQDELVKITGRKKADYYTVMNPVERPAEPAYVPKPLKIIANFEILLDAPKTLTLGVFDSSGKMIQPVFENQSFSHAGHRFGVEFESADVPAGYYYIRLKEGDEILKEKMVKVD
jgi:hypothetical protein